jgi:hypothetical protein
MDVEHLRKTLMLSSFSRRALGQTGHGVASCPKTPYLVNSSIGLMPTGYCRVSTLSLSAEIRRSFLQFPSGLRPSF